MTTQQQIDDPGQWRVGDDVSVTFEDGATLTGKFRERFGGELWVGDRALRYTSGSLGPRAAQAVVTRTVEPIPEPTEWLSGVRFADGTAAARVFMLAPAWGESGAVVCGGLTWEDLLKRHGAPVAVSLPRWSDEVDGLRARVEAFIAELDRDGFEILNASHEARRLRALLAEGGEA